MPSTDAPPHLQLVHSRPAGDPEHQVRNVTLTPSALRLRTQVLRRGLATGVPIDIDALTAVLGAKMSGDARPVNHFTEEVVWQLIWVDVFAWCTNRGLDVPDGVLDALWALVNHLEEIEGFHPDSESFEDLQLPLLSSGGLDQSGRRRAKTP